MRKGQSIETVREIASTLDGVEESTAWSAMALKVQGRLMACQAIHKSAEPNSLMARVGFEERDELIAGDPAVYYVTEHYVSYPSVLVRLSAIRRDALEGLLRMAWRFAITKGPVKSRKRPAGRRRRS